MIFASRLIDKLSDDRFDANLIAFYGAIVVVILLALVLRRFLSRDEPVRWTGLCWLDALGDEAAAHARRLLFWSTIGGIVLFSFVGLGYHLAGRDVRHDLGRFLDRLPPETALTLALEVAACVGLLLASQAGVWLLRRLRPVVQDHVAGLLGPMAGRETLEHGFGLLERFAAAAVRLGAVWAAANVLGFGALADRTVGFALRVGAIVAAARLLVLAGAMFTRIALELGDRHLGAAGKAQPYWDRLRLLLPLAERCFAWAVFIVAGSECIRHVLPRSWLIDDDLPGGISLGQVAAKGPLLVHCIAIFLVTRTAVEMLQVMLHDAFRLDQEDVDDAKGRTLVPLLHSLAQYVLYFGAAVMMLAHLGVNIQPILAGAGIVGLAVGLGAQSLVADVVSGFFILFESQYLVGDYVQIGDASGVVEEVGIRNTKVRDAEGKLHIIPNGQIKGVVSFSKGFVNAVVDIKVPAGNDVEGVFRAMTEAGRRLKLMHKEVLSDTVIQGLVDLGNNDMTVRAVTRVQPGRHLLMQNEYRRILKAVLDEERPTAKAA